MIVLDDTTLLDTLREDAPFGDLTTRSLSINSVPSQMAFQARYPMTVCGIEEAARLLTLIGCKVILLSASGDRCDAGAMLLEAEGLAEQIFLGWKVSQTLVEWASGVATATNELVSAAKAANPKIVVACTRKAIPRTRALSAKAVLAGGATLHRTGLSDSILLFPEHFRVAAALSLTMEQQVAQLKAANPERYVVAEVNEVFEALEAADAGVDVLQLEKFQPDDIAEVIQRLSGQKKPKIAAAGGINSKNARDYAESGAQILVTSASYYSKPADVEVTISPVE
jgi:molybdenum transport protein